MKKANYSGGDWKMKELKGWNETCISNQDGTIANVYLNQKANAKLICAAPRLLETLQTILDRLGTNPMQDDELAKICRREIKAVI